MSQAGLARITTQVLPPGLIQTINGDTGSITGNTVTIFANQAMINSGSSVSFNNSGTVSTLNLTDGFYNTLIGMNCGNSSISNVNNTGMGYDCFFALTSSTENSGIGVGCLANLTSGSGRNCAFGYGSGGQLVTGAYNVLYGYDSGHNYTGSESSNICIGNLGVLGESNVIRIGTPGSGTGQQNKAVLAGVTGVTAVGSPVAVSSTGQLSDLGFGTATQVLTSNGAGVSPTWQAAGGGGGTNATFSAYMTNNVTNVTGDGTNYQMIYDTTNVNQGSVYNTSTGVFTAPVTGNYNFSFNMLCNTVLSFTSDNFFLYKNGSPFIQFFGATLPGTNSYASIFASGMIPLTAGDTVTVVVSCETTGSTKDVGIFGGTTLCRFSGNQIA